MRIPFAAREQAGPTVPAGAAVLPGVPARGKSPLSRLRVRLQPKQIPGQNVGWHTLSGPGLLPGRERMPWSIREFLGTYGGTDDSVIWVFACVNRISTEMAAYPWNIGEKDGEVLEREDVPEELEDLLEMPNKQTRLTYFDYAQLVTMDLELAGNSYWLKDDMNALKQPSMLQRLRPEMMQIAADDFGNITGYVYQVQGISIPYEVDEVMHFKYPSPGDDYYGMGTVEAIQRELGLALLQSHHVTGFFAEGARISGLLTIDGAMSDEQFQRMKTEFTQNYIGGKNQFRIMVAEQGVNFTPIIEPPASSGVVELQPMTKDAIITGFGVPEFLLGGTAQAGIYKMSEAQHILTRNMMPRAIRYSERMTYDLIALWGDLLFQIDQEVTETQEDRTNRAATLWGAGGPVSMNEWREMNGLAPLDDENADIPTVFEGRVPYTKVFEEPEPPLEGEVVGGPPELPPGPEETAQPELPSGEPDENALPDGLSLIEEGVLATEVETKDEVVRPFVPGSVKRAAKVPKLPAGLEKLPDKLTLNEADAELAEQILAARADTWTDAVATIEAALRGFFVEQRKRILTKLKSFDTEAAAKRFNGRRGREVRYGKKALKIDRVWDEGEEDKHFVEAFLKAGDSVAAEMLDKVAPHIDVHIDWDAKNPEVKKVRAILAKRVVRVNKTTRAAIAETIEEGLRRGYSIPQIANGFEKEHFPGIVGVFDRATLARAETIARTETANVQNTAAVLAYGKGGADRVEVIDGTEYDEACREANGEIWTLGRALREPTEHPNCVRTFIPLMPVKLEEEKRFNPNQLRDEQGRWTDEPGGGLRLRQPSTTHADLLADALHSWKGSPNTMRIHLHHELEGDPEPSSAGGREMRAQARALLRELRENAKPIPKRGLFRGGGVRGVGPFPFSESKPEARKFGGAEPDVLVDAEGLRVGDYQAAQYGREKEWIVLGPFEKGEDGKLRQVRPTLAKLTPAKQAARQWASDAYDEVVNNGGFTRSIVPNAKPPARYISAAEGAEVKIKADEFGPDDIGRYAAAHQTALGSPSVYVGAWRNDDDGYVYLDLSTSFDSREAAIQYGKQNHQIAIWDGQEMAEIRLSDEKAAPSQQARIEGMRRMYGNVMPPPKEDLDFSVFEEDTEEDEEPSSRKAFLDWLATDPEAADWHGFEAEAWEEYKVWRETQHPRDEHGRFSEIPIRAWTPEEIFEHQWFGRAARGLPAPEGLPEKGRRSKQSYRKALENAKQFQPKNGPVRAPRPGPDASAEDKARASVVVAGRVTPEQWMERTEKMWHDVGHYSDEDVEGFAKWYDDFEPAFQLAFGDRGEEIGRAWIIANANQSPEGAVGTMMNVLEGLAQGNLESVGNYTPELLRLLQGRQAESQVGQKISDFGDALIGRERRSYFGDDPDFGTPVVADVWAHRDVGYIDKGWMGSERAGITLGRFADVKTLASDEVSLPGNPGRYEKVAQFYQDLVPTLNKRKFLGRDDWTPNQAQAIGWGAMHILYGQHGLAIWESMQRQSSFVNLPQGDAHGDLPPFKDVKPEVANAITEEALRAVVPDLADDVGVEVLGVGYGPESQGDELHPFSQVQVLSTPEGAAVFGDALAAVTGRNDPIRISKIGASGRGGSETIKKIGAAESKQVLIVEHPGLKDPAALARFWESIRGTKGVEYLEPLSYEDLQGQQRNGVMVFVPPAAGKNKQQRIANVQAKYQQAIQDALAQAGIDTVTEEVAYHADYAQVRDREGDWEARTARVAAADAPLAERLESVYEPRFRQALREAAARHLGDDYLNWAGQKLGAVAEGISAGRSGTKAWRESQHPRDTHGRFRGLGGGGLTKLLAREKVLGQQENEAWDEWQKAQQAEVAAIKAGDDDEAAVWEGKKKLWADLWVERSRAHHDLRAKIRDARAKERKAWWKAKTPWPPQPPQVTPIPSAEVRDRLYDTPIDLNSGDAHELGGGHVNSVYRVGGLVVKPESGLSDFGQLRHNIPAGSDLEREAGAALMNDIMREHDPAFAVRTPGYAIRDDVRFTPYGASEGLGGTVKAGVQEYVNGDASTLAGHDAWSLTPFLHDADVSVKQARNAMLFDGIIGNEDRHAGNAMLDPTDGGDFKYDLVLIDNGLSFPTTNDTSYNASGPIPDAIADTQGGFKLEPGEVEFLKKLQADEQSIRERLSPYVPSIPDEEGHSPADAMFERINDMVSTGLFWPQAGERAEREREEAAAREQEGEQEVFQEAFQLAEPPLEGVVTPPWERTPRTQTLARLKRVIDGSVGQPEMKAHFRRLIDRAEAKERAKVTMGVGG
jgi:HK97 family phage portal protein